MLLSAAAVALTFVQPAVSLAQPVFHSDQTVPCGPDSSKSIGCNANKYGSARKTAMTMPLVCNHDPLKGAACHAHVAIAKAEQRAQQRSDERLATAD